MKKHTAIFVTTILMAVSLLVSFPPSIVSQEDSGSSKPNPNTEKTDGRIQDLIEKLGDDSREVREKATRALVEIGKPALDALKKARENTRDPEVLWRINDAISRIKKEGSDERKPDTPDTPSLREQLDVQTTRIIRGPDGETVRITREGKKGPVTVRVRRRKNGKTKEETYRAESVKKFRKRYPDIAKKYNIEQSSGFSFRLSRPGGIEPEKNFGERGKKPLKKFEKQMQKWLNEFDESFKPFEPFEFGPEFPEPRSFGELQKELQKEFKKLRKQFDGLRREEDETNKTSLGATFEEPDPALRHQLNLSDNAGIVVRDVRSNHVLDRVGLQEWDVIISVNGTTVRSSNHVRTLLREGMETGNPIRITVYRSGEEQVISGDPSAYSSGTGEDKNKRREKEDKKDSSRSKDY